MSLITSLGDMVSEISIFVEIFNVHLTLPAARGRHVLRGRHARVVTDMVFLNANSGVENQGYVANSGTTCLNKDVLCFFES